VKLYHPDRFATESDKLETYHALTTAINKAKGAGDIETLREIAADPHAYVARQGWVDLDLREEEELEQLQKLHAALLLEITAVLDSLANLRATQEFRLCLKCDMEPQGLAGIASTLAIQLQTECEALGKEEEELALEIARLRAA
jgi:DNA polymerase-3 subunit epsilon